MLLNGYNELFVLALSTCFSYIAELRTVTIRHKTMKRILLFLAIVFPLFIIQAQTPRAFNYQAVVRDSPGAIIGEYQVYICEDTEEMEVGETLVRKSFCFTNEKIKVFVNCK